MSTIKNDVPTAIKCLCQTCDDINSLESRLGMPSVLKADGSADSRSVLHL